ncbi:ACT domain-containing protein [Allokutzneria sp. A3M-2-11 16]|uniref:ACT domain-containing protein n=1 Tax=Allokutzneria sp. A3M-2-11 16 TaxID=2962043 RepID=UPI003F8D3926
MELDLRSEPYSVLRLAADAPAPVEVLAAQGFVSVTRTPDELSVVCPTAVAPPADEAEGGWRLLTARGPFDFALTGIMAALSTPLAEAGVPLFALSTYDTDHLMVREEHLHRAITALENAGHRVHAEVGRSSSPTNPSANDR